MDREEAQAIVPQARENTRKKGGRKRARAREIAQFLRAELPQALAESGDLERVAEDYGVAKIEVLTEAVLSLMRRPMGSAPARMHVLRRTA